MSDFLNFQKLPSEAPDNTVKPGVHNFKIRVGIVEKTFEGQQRLVTENVVVSQEKVMVKDYFILFNEDGTPNTFGQYKLRALMEAINVKPEGDFSLKILPELVKDKVFSCDVTTRKVGDKTYLNIGRPETFGAPIQPAIPEFKAPEGTTGTTVIKGPITTSTKEPDKLPNAVKEFIGEGTIIPDEEI